MALLTTAALLLSDRAPGILRTLFGDRARRLWERIDAGNRVDLPAGADVATQPDFVVHIVLWTVVTGLVGVTIWTWRGLFVAAAMLAATGVGLELAQGRLATTRNVEASDALANLIGIGVGTTLAGCCYVTWSAGAALLRTPRPDRT